MFINIGRLTKKWFNILFLIAQHYLKKKKIATENEF